MEAKFTKVGLSLNSRPGGINAGRFQPMSLQAESFTDMICSRLCSTLVLATACFLSAPVVSTERAITCDHSGNVHRLSCDTGVISVQAALYGRADTETCSEGIRPQRLNNTECSLEGAVELLQSRCDGRSVCETNTADVGTSDPCDGVHKYLETNYTCLPALRLVACEGSVAHLHCDVSQIIFVYGADYGRHDQTTCGYSQPAELIEDVHCSNSTNKVAESCNGRNNCTIAAANSVFGNPCPDTYKYLEVAYICEYPSVAAEQHRTV